MSWSFVVPPTPADSFADAASSNAEAHIGILNSTLAASFPVQDAGKDVTVTDPAVLVDPNAPPLPLPMPPQDNVGSLSDLGVDGQPVTDGAPVPAPTVAKETADQIRQAAKLMADFVAAGVLGDPAAAKGSWSGIAEGHANPGYEGSAYITVTVSSS